MTTSLTKCTKAELLYYISELESEHLIEVDELEAEIAELEKNGAAEYKALKKRIDNFAAAIETPFPMLHRNLKSALDNQLFWVDEPPTGYVSAPIPAAATHVRWVFEDNTIEFQYSGTGARHWARPLDGAFTEQS